MESRSTRETQWFDTSLLDRPVYCAIHRDEVFCALRHGALNSTDSSFPVRSVWKPEITKQRNDVVIPHLEGTNVNHFVPFTFTSKTPALLNVSTGWRDTPKVPNHEIAFLTTTPRALLTALVPFLVAPLQPFRPEAYFVGPWPGLCEVDYTLIDSGSFVNTPADPLRSARAGAELLAHDRVPNQAFAECIVWEEPEVIEDQLSKIESLKNLKIVQKREQFFPKRD